MNAVAQVEEFLRERHRAALDAFGAPLGQNLEIVEPITKWEAFYFMKGLEQQLFLVDDQSYVQSPLLPSARKKSAPQQRAIQVFWKHGDPQRILFREGINQIATACRLIFEYGWSVDEIKMEPSEEEFGDLGYGVDIILVRPNGRIPFCVENKSTNYEFEKLVKQFSSCCSLGEHPRKGCKDRINHPKYEFCLKARSKYCWFVSPRKEIFYELSYLDNGIIQISELPDPLDRETILSGWNGG